jgi:hypothetical protein
LLTFEFPNDRTTEHEVSHPRDLGLINVGDRVFLLLSRQGHVHTVQFLRIDMISSNKIPCVDFVPLLWNNGASFGGFGFFAAALALHLCVALSNSNQFPHSHIHHG